jgi:hypothetical protein
MTTATKTKQDVVISYYKGKAIRSHTHLNKKYYLQSSLVNTWGVRFIPHLIEEVISKRLTDLGNSQNHNLIRALDFKQAFNKLEALDKPKKKASSEAGTGSKTHSVNTTKHIATQLDMCFEPSKTREQRTTEATLYTSALQTTPLKSLGDAVVCSLPTVSSAPTLSNQEIRNEIEHIFKNYLANKYAAGSNNELTRNKLYKEHRYTLYTKCYEVSDVELMRRFNVNKQGLKNMGYRQRPGKNYIEVLEEKGELGSLLKIAEDLYGKSSQE